MFRMLCVKGTCRRKVDLVKKSQEKTFHDLENNQILIQGLHGDIDCKIRQYANIA